MPSPPIPLVIFTIIAKNYAAFAETLMESVTLHHPAARRIIVLCDEPGPTPPASAFAEIVSARTIVGSAFPAMAMHYGVMELATAIKPTMIQWLLARHHGAHVVYLDPDILVTAPLIHVTEALGAGAALVLTPHITAPLQDGRQPDDLAIMRSGIYNLGFAAFRETPDSLAFLAWWADRCERDAIVDIPAHKFTDQRWMDMAPAFLPATHILHHPGYNLAYWNLGQRRVTRKGRQTLVNDERLRFVHFSGIDPADRTKVSKHQDRFTAAQLGPLRPLFDHYLDRVAAHGWEGSRSAPYAYARFDNGRPVHHAMRLAYRRHRDTMGEAGADPLAATGAFYDAPAPELAPLGPPAITRVMAALWHERPDLQRAFDLQAAPGRAAFLAWFMTEALATGFDAASVAAARALQPGAIPVHRILPWVPQAPRSRAVPLDAWLAQPVELAVAGAAGIPMPRQLALLWERRQDVAAYFPCQTEAGLEAFLLWSVIEGVAERDVDLGIVGPVLAPFFAHVEQPGLPDAPPITRLMRLGAPHYNGPLRELLAAGKMEPDGRALLALWLAGPAARASAWPAEFTAPLRAWLDQPAPGFGGALPLGNFGHALWNLRPDVRAAFDIASGAGQLGFLTWMLDHGLAEMKLSRADLPVGLQSMLAEPLNPPVPGIAWRDPLAPAPVPGAKPVSAPASKPVPRTPDPGAPILLTGIVTSVSGRGEDVRLTAAALQAVQAPVLMLDRVTERYTDGATLLPETARPGFSVNIVHLNAESASADYIFLRSLGASGAPTIGHWAWELASFPPIWAQSFSYYDEIWTHTAYSRDAIARATDRPVFVMPAPVAAPHVDPALTRARFGLRDGRFVFYFGFDFRSFVARKNPEAAIAAFRLAFPRGDEPVTLVLKTLSGIHKADQLAALRDQVSIDPRIVVQDCEYTAVELASLINLCDCFLSLHRAEGFGRGPAEAMLLGKPVIATGYSGNMEFMTPRNALLVDYTLVPVGPNEYPGWQGQEWADPSPAHAAEHMRLLARDPAAAHRIGAAAARDIKRCHDPKLTGAWITGRLAALKVRT